MRPAELGALYRKANAGRISNGRSGRLRFSVMQGEGYVFAGTADLAECLCELWNAAPELIAALTTVTDGDSARVSDMSGGL